MAQSKAERPSFTFNKGLNSDAQAVTFPTDFSSDELNFELLLDGTRRRRRGVEPETGDLTAEGIDGASESAVRTFKWRSVASNPDLNFHVWQVGTTLYFADDVERPSANLRGFTLDLLNLKALGWEDIDVLENMVDMAFGRGEAIVTGKCVLPTRIKYDEDSDTITTYPIDIKERDFQGLEDGIGNNVNPATLSDSYLYNLLNSGWRYNDIITYFNDQEEYPAKNMIPWMGYRRKTVTGYNADDGTKEFSPDKLVEELFQDAPAPRGYFIRNPFDTTIDTTADEDDTKNYMEGGHSGLPRNMFVYGIYQGDNPNYLNMPPPAETLTLISARFVNPHGLSAGDSITFYVESYAEEQHGRIGRSSAGWFENPRDRWWGRPFYGNSPYTVEEVVDSHTIKFYLKMGGPGDGNDTDYGHSTNVGSWPHVYILANFIPINITGAVINERPTCTAFFAGRAWYAGVPHPALSDALFFSQVIESDAQYGKCYQVADPTDANISDLVDTDGGALRIPEMGRCLKLLPYSSSMIVFATNGVWQIGPGSSGYFTATSYSVRKISDIGCVSATSVLEAEGIPLYWGHAGIFAIIQDTNTGYLTAQSLTKDRLDNYYTDIGMSGRQMSSGDFDAVNKRAVWVYEKTTYDEFGYPEEGHYALVYDTKFNAFSPWRFGARMYDVFTTTEVDYDTRSTIRYLVYQSSNGTFTVGTATSLQFQDFGIEKEAYMVTGFDTANSPTRIKQAPVIHAFMKRTELVDDDLVYNESSITMQSRWDWSDNTVAGKWGQAYQIYRHSRPFTVDEGEDSGALPDGAPVIVTRNKVSGRGRALHIKFAAGQGKDAHILGWSTNFLVLNDN